jgi:quercetin dioxygenase-like cupin family protein
MAAPACGRLRVLAAFPRTPIQRRNAVKSSLLFAVALVPAFALVQAAQSNATPQADRAASAHSMVKASDTKWGDAPPSLPKGAQAAVLYGDPTKPGPFAIRIKAPPGFKIPRHWHPSDEQVTIISGDFMLSMGDAGSAHEGTFGPGDFISLPSKMQHEGSTKNGVVVQVNSMGPFEINYVDPKDDPRNAAMAK